jgi:DNA polymerase elongation subunit (family B)
VHLPGRSKDDAFLIGREIAEYITAKSPPEVILKFEKVYLPSILVTKKRYVGNSYEAEDQIQPHLDAKGIEIYSTCLLRINRFLFIHPPFEYSYSSAKTIRSALLISWK